MKTQALSRLRETATPGPALQHVHNMAVQVFGPEIDFEPLDTVNIAGGTPHVHVVPKRSPTLQQLTYFSKLLLGAGVNTVKVQSVAPDLDHGPRSIKVEFYTRLR